jgi:hypothetical protein
MTSKNKEVANQFTGFWYFIASAIAQDRELLLYFFFYAIFLSAPVFIVLHLLQGAEIQKNEVITMGVGVWLISTVFTRVFGFAIAFTEVERSRGGNPTPSSTFSYLLKKSRLIFKLAAICLVVDFLQIVIATLVDRVLERVLGIRAPVSRFLVRIFFGVTDFTKEVFLGFLIPVAVCTDHEDIRELSKETYKVVKSAFSGAVGLNIRLVVLSFVWVTIFILAIFLVPQFAPGLMHGVTIALLYSIFPLGWFLSLCSTLVYSRAVALILDQKISEKERTLALSGLGFRNVAGVVS